MNAPLVETRTPPGGQPAQEPKARLKAVFVISKFPCYDEAFILRELYAMSKEMDLSIFSLKKSKESIVHDQARELLPQTFYVPYFFSCKVAGAVLRTLFTRPVRFFRALVRAIAGNARSWEFLAKTLVLFPKAVYLAQWIRENGVNTIHAYWATYPASVALIASEISGVPFNFTGHAHDIYLNTTHLREKIERATFVSTCTSQNRDYLCKLAPGMPADKILVNYHGLDLTKFETEGKARNPVFNILSVGTLNPHKGFSVFLNALGELHKKGLNFEATIIGGGPLESDLRRHVRMLGLEEKVTMTGPLKQAEVIPYYKKADVCVLMAQPEWHWGIPNVLIEALAARAAVITTLFGSVEELVQDGVTGLIVPPKDPAPLADALEKLYRDDGLRVRLMEAGRGIVLKNFDLSRNIREFIRRMA